MTEPAEKHYISSVASIDDAEAFAPDSSHGIMVRMVGHGKRVLEVGCASGYMSRRLTQLGNRVTGLDYDAAAVDEARPFCEAVVVADLDRQTLRAAVEDRRFDVIVFGDVLEHLRTPWQVLEDSRELLAPNGYAVISIPNIAHGSVRLSLLRGTFEYSEFGILDNTHLRFFTLRTIRELCSRAGYRIDVLDRTKVPMFQPSDVIPQVAADWCDPDVIDAIRRDPEHDTLQFVFRASPVPEADQLRVARDDLSDSSQQLAEASATIRVLQSRGERQATAAARVAELEVLLAERSAEADAAYVGLERMRVEREELLRANTSLEEQVRSSNQLLDEKLAEQALIIGRLRADLRKGQEAVRELQQSYRTVSDMFADHLAVETSIVRASATAVDLKIQAIQQSPIWRMKKLLRGAGRGTSKGDARA